MLKICFKKIGINLISFNSNLKNDNSLNDLLALLIDKIGNRFGNVDIINEFKNNYFRGGLYEQI